ncbi:glycosyltransferase family 4 protein [Patescibacteria group bacterium]|nr:glycosyltransferase family 4 protein [Patescibacteria group bacterium]MBU1890874.1 glycosyltransferase family 4 protein [Patescibacteria group bacterium]
MKNSLLATLDYLPKHGGVERYYHNIVSRLPPQDIAVLTQPYSGGNDFDLKQDYKIIRKKLLTHWPIIWPKWANMIPYLKSYIDQNKVEVIQVGQVLPVGNAVYYLQKLKKIPYIVYTHGMDITIPQAQASKKRIMQKVLQQARYIVANSSFTKDELLTLGLPDDKIKIITPGCDLIGDTPDTARVEKLRQKYSLAEKKVLLTIGRLEKRKGHDMVISALNEIKDKHSNIVYLIVGQGQYENELRSLVEKYQLTNQVIFTGSINDEDRSAYYQLCDIFIMPVRELSDRDVEGFGIVYIEANAMGKPVIGGRSGGVRDAIIDGETGLMVNPNDERDIAKAIEKLINNNELAQRLGTKGRVRAENDFKWLDRAKQVEQLIETI